MAEQAARRVVYKCPLCLRMSEWPGGCDKGPLVPCEAGEPGSEACKPLQAPDGRLLTRAPRWWILTTWKTYRTFHRTGRDD